MRFYSFFLAPLRNIGSVLYPDTPRQENPNENREFILVVDSPPPPPPPLGRPMFKICRAG